MKRLEEIKMEQVELSSESEKGKQKKLQEMSELASILMAIENIEQKCFNRKYDNSYGKSQRLAILKHAIVPNTKPKNYDDFIKSHAYAKKQLAVINNYAQDFKEIVAGLYADKDVNAMIQKNSDLIIWPIDAKLCKMIRQIHVLCNILRMSSNNKLFDINSRKLKILN